MVQLTNLAEVNHIPSDLNAIPSTQNNTFNFDSQDSQPTQDHNSYEQARNNWCTLAADYF